MFWFKKKEVAPDTSQSVAQHSAIEIVAHKDAKAEALQEVKAANDHLNKVLVNNGFTLKIYLAAGGQEPKRGSR